MSVRYHVLASDELMAGNPLWPDGFRPVEQESTDPARYPGMHWWLVEDDNAPADLEDKRVELTFGVSFDDDGIRPTIDDRTPWPAP